MERSITRRFHFYCSYFDVCNEQAFLYEKERDSLYNVEGVERRREGIEENLRRPAFQRAWSEIAQRVPDSFDELRRLSAPARIQSKITVRCS